MPVAGHSKTQSSDPLEQCQSASRYSKAVFMDKLNVPANLMLVSDLDSTMVHNLALKLAKKRTNGSQLQKLSYYIQYQFGTGGYRNTKPAKYCTEIEIYEHCLINKMKENNNLDKEVDHEDPDNLSLLRFNALWESTYRQDSILIFSTGRSPTLYKTLRKEKPILTPDITITSVGTEIAYGEEMVPDEGWIQLLSKNWDRNVVLEETAKYPELVPQSDRDQGPHKVSFKIPKEKAQEVITPLYASLTKRGLDVKIIYSFGIDLDVLPKEAGKGHALAYLLNKFGSIGKSPKNILVCGDSGNDAEMFTVEGVYGVMVSNSTEELLEWYEQNAKNNHKIVNAKERCASGIIQAVSHFQLGHSISPRDIKPSFSNEDNRKPAYVMVNFYLLYERWRRAEAEKSEAIIQYLKSITHSTGVIVHPSGSEDSIHRSIDVLDSCHGDQRGRSFRVWLDKVLVSAIGLDSWLVKFNKWELNGQSCRCCVTTVLLNSKAETPGFSIMHIHQTWLEEYISCRSCL